MVVQPFHNKKIIFIVGAPRSGTTYLQKLLATHPNIHTGQETDLFSLYIGPQMRAWEKYINTKNTGREAKGIACYLTEKEFADNLRNYLQRFVDAMYEELEPEDYFLEKTPAHAFYIPEILAFFPNAKIIHIRRKPDAVISSLLHASRTWGSSWAPKTVRSAYFSWYRHLRAVKKHTSIIPNGNFFEVSFEELIEKPTQTLNPILNNLLHLEATPQDIQQIVDHYKLHNNDLIVKGEFARILGKTRLDEPKAFSRDAGQIRKKKRKIPFIQRQFLSAYLWYKRRKEPHLHQ